MKLFSFFFKKVLPFCLLTSLLALPVMATGENNPLTLSTQLLTFASTTVRSCYGKTKHYIKAKTIRPGPINALSLLFATTANKDLQLHVLQFLSSIDLGRLGRTSRSFDLTVQSMPPYLLNGFNLKNITKRQCRHLFARISRNLQAPSNLEVQPEPPSEGGTPVRQDYMRGYQKLTVSAQINQQDFEALVTFLPHVTDFDASKIHILPFLEFAKGRWTELRHLKLSCMMRESQIPILDCCVSFSNLTVLSMHRLLIDDENFEYLVTICHREGLPNLSRLDCSDNYLRDVSCLSTMQPLFERLVEFDLSCNCIGLEDQDIESFLQAINDGRFPCLQTLDLSFNHCSEQLVSRFQREIILKRPTFVIKLEGIMAQVLRSCVIA